MMVLSTPYLIGKHKVNRFLASISLLLALAGTPAFSAETIKTVAWTTAPANLPDGVSARVLPHDILGTILQVTCTKAPAAPIRLGVIDSPGTLGAHYGVLGLVRCEHVEGTGYLELWSVFTPSERYFTRTMAQVGPMQTLTGTQAWRAFALPFTQSEHVRAPQQLEINLVLAGAGIIDIGPLTINSYEKDENAVSDASLNLVPPGQWFGLRTAVYAGAGGGALLGLLGALFGLLARRGQARALVLGGLGAFFLAGLVSFGLGIFALIHGQPYAVYYTLLLFGGILTVVSASLWPNLCKQYNANELQKISAADG